jgi:hypothetical protein
MPEKPKEDRLWLVLCTATGVIVDVTLNKYSGQLPDWVVLALWGIPMILFVVWLWRVEKTRDWVRRRFLEHPVSYIVMSLIFIPFVWQATSTMISKLRFSAPIVQKALPQAPNPQQPKIASPAAQTPSVAQKPSASIQSKQPKEHVKRKTASQEAPNTTLPETAPAPAQALAQPTYGSQTCVGSACAQGTGSQATYNQYGAPKLLMTDEQRDTIRDAMKPFAGMTVTIACNNATEDTLTYANQLSKALNDAGLTAGVPLSVIEIPPPGHVIPSGLQFEASDDLLSAAATLAHTMRRLGLITKPIPLERIPGKAQFGITISPNR